MAFDQKSPFPSVSQCKGVDRQTGRQTHTHTHPLTCADIATYRLNGQGTGRGKIRGGEIYIYLNIKILYKLCNRNVKNIQKACIIVTVYQGELLSIFIIRSWWATSFNVFLNTYQYVHYN